MRPFHRWRAGKTGRRARFHVSERPDGAPHPEIRPPWSRSDRPVPRRILRPLQEFLSSRHRERHWCCSSRRVVALAWANSPWGGAYDAVLAHAAELRRGRGAIGDDLRHLGERRADDAVLPRGRSRDQARAPDGRAAAIGEPPLLPVVGRGRRDDRARAALRRAERGRRRLVRTGAIPMATDIAFALGVLVLAARHAPAGCKPFILTLAIVDDIGAIVVIALFYAGGVSVGFLAVGGGRLRAPDAPAPSVPTSGRRSVFVGPRSSSSGSRRTSRGSIRRSRASCSASSLPPSSYQRPRAVSAEARRTADQTMDDPAAAGCGRGQWLRLASLSREAVSPLTRIEHACSRGRAS